jgi:hypothetical protein
MTIVLACVAGLYLGERLGSMAVWVIERKTAQ